MIEKLNNFYLYRKFAAWAHRKQVEKDPIAEINRYYKLVFGHLPNLQNPQNLVEKIFWMELNGDTSLWSKCSDKYRMREYVASCELDQYLPQLFGVWDNPKDIDLSILPKQFVIKANNGCGTVKVVKDKNTIIESQLKKELQQWLAIPYGYAGCQLHYLKIKPCVLAEELLKQSDELNSFSPCSMVDYKVWCINGKPESILVTYNRQNGNHNLDLYDLNWKRKRDCINFNGRFGFKDDEVPKPRSLEEMLMIAERLSSPFPEVRVDFYEVKGKPVIGEMTFSAGFGNLTEDYYLYLGNKIDLKNEKA